MSEQQQPQVVVMAAKQGNGVSFGLGITAMILGVFALLISWIPFVGLLAWPLAIVGIILAGIGLLVALVRKFQGILMPIIGGALCVTAILVTIVSTGATAAAMSDMGQTIDQSHRRMEQQMRRQEQQVQDDQMQPAPPITE
jgi:glucose dehydrogenase